MWDFSFIQVTGKVKPPGISSKFVEAT